MLRSAEGGQNDGDNHTATVSRNGNAIAQLDWGTFCVGEDGNGNCEEWYELPFAGDDAE